MSKEQIPTGSFHITVPVDFGRDGWRKLDIVDILKQAGFSSSSAKRLLKNRAVEVWGGEIIDNHIYYNWQKAERFELFWADDYMFRIIMLDKSESHRRVIELNPNTKTRRK